MSSLKCPNCKKKIEKEWQKCPHCNETLKKICRKCGQELKEEWVSCPNCGKNHVNYKKLKVVAIGIITLFLIGIILSNVVYMDYPVEETYMDKEAYTDTETYTVLEPYSVTSPVSKNEYYVVCGDSWYPVSKTSEYTECLITGTYLYNEDVGWFNTLTGTPLLEKYKPGYIPPEQEQHEYKFDPQNYWIMPPYPWSVMVYKSSIDYPVTDFINVYSDSIPKTQCICSVEAKTIIVEEKVTGLKNVEKTRIVTKYRDVEKTRTITKKVKIWDIIFDNI